jgi:hypothetical protein
LSRAGTHVNSHIIDKADGKTLRPLDGYTAGRFSDCCAIQPRFIDRGERFTWTGYEWQQEYRDNGRRGRDGGRRGR